MADPRCVRRAWLTLGSAAVDLDNPAGGWFCSSLDLGYPDVRDVVNNHPDRDGVDDRTAYMGGRVISADITALAGAGARIDAVAASFAPFMVPSARPTLHYILDRPGAAERTFRVRASGYSWPIAGPDQRDINLQWMAADPVARDPNTQTVIAWAGSGSAGGRIYPLTYNRIYPAGGSAPTLGNIVSYGDAPVRPLLRVYGPITAAHVALTLADRSMVWYVWLLNSAIIGAGQYVDIDTTRKTVNLMGDPAQSVVTWLDWTNTRWPVLPVFPGPATLLQVTGTNTSGVTQVQAIWNDGYLT